MSEAPRDADPAPGLPGAALVTDIPGPVGARDRILTLDVLRGVAVLGILLVNVLFFAFTLGEFEDVTWRDLPSLDGAARLFIEFFAEFKFISIFSLLFGMGLALQSERAKREGRPFAGRYSRRLIVLLVFGLAHGVLLWYGDILAPYALVGFIALLCRNIRPRALLIAAVVLFLVPLGVLGGCSLVLPGQDVTRSLDWNELADQIEEERRQRRESAPAPSQPATSAAVSVTTSKPISNAPTTGKEHGAHDFDVVQFFRFLADEERVYQSGTWGELVLHRSVHFAMFLIIAYPIFVGWRCLALFLLGIYFVRLGLFDDSDRHRRTYRYLLGLGLLLGIALQVAGILVLGPDPDSPSLRLINAFLFYLGSLGMALGYVGAIALICLRRDWVSYLRPFAAVGRMALTNYLCQSIICGLIFYSYGLGLFGRLSYAAAVLLVFAIFAAQLVICPLWLRRFQFGPFEWLWRSMTYWRIQQFLRRVPHAATPSGGATP